MMHDGFMWEGGSGRMIYESGENDKSSTQLNVNVGWEWLAGIRNAVMKSQKYEISGGSCIHRKWDDPIG